MEGYDLVLVDNVWLCYRDAEWDAAFNFSDNSDYLQGCLQQTKGMRWSINSSEILIFSTLKSASLSGLPLKPCRMMFVTI